jgi:hypothetical protein
MEPVREYIIKDKGLEDLKADLPVPELEENEQIPPTLKEVERINEEIRSVTQTVRQSQESGKDRPWGYVKSTRIYKGVPSQEHMANQGKSIEEIKGPDMSVPEMPINERLYRGVPISSWSTEDYINVTPQKFHKALRNQTVPSSKSYHPRRIVVPGEETDVEQRTAPISTWGVQDYLNVTPQSKHRAIKEMQKAPLVIPGEIPDVIPQKKPINELDRKDKQSSTPSAIYNAISNQGGTFTVGSSRSYEEITITISTDYYAGESSWNLYDSTAGAFIILQRRRFLLRMKPKRLQKRSCQEPTL